MQAHGKPLFTRRFYFDRLFSKKCEAMISWYLCETKFPLSERRVKLLLRLLTESGVLQSYSPESNKTETISALPYWAAKCNAFLPSWKKKNIWINYLWSTHTMHAISNVIGDIVLIFKLLAYIYTIVWGEKKPMSLQKWVALFHKTRWQIKGWKGK